MSWTIRLRQVSHRIRRRYRGRQKTHWPWRTEAPLQCKQDMCGTAGNASLTVLKPGANEGSIPVGSHPAQKDITADHIDNTLQDNILQQELWLWTYSWTLYICAYIGNTPELLYFRLESLKLLLYTAKQFLIYNTSLTCNISLLQIGVRTY